MKEAMFYERLEDKKVRCFLCMHHCKIRDGSRGICAVRENVDGKLYSLVYGRVVSSNIDPIEKKPLFHFLPASASFSIATVGCNFRCLHCQNFEISQYPRINREIIGEELSPYEIVEAAERAGCKSISYTYTEPTIFFEFAYDCARIARERGIKNVFVSNGYTSPEAIKVITPFLDGNNIDLKGDDEFYKRICGARVEPVKETIRLMKEAGVWVEVTTLIIPTLNDSDRVIEGIIDFIISVDPAIPWHVTQFYPTYKMLDKGRTPLETLRRARALGLKKGLRYVYEGNVPGAGNENTYCPACGETLVSRYGFHVLQNRIKDGRCFNCMREIEGIWGE